MLTAETTACPRHNDHSTVAEFAHGGGSYETAPMRYGVTIFATDRNQQTGTQMEYDAAGRVTNTIRRLGARITIEWGTNGVPRSFVADWGTPISTNSILSYVARVGVE